MTTTKNPLTDTQLALAGQWWPYARTIARRARDRYPDVPVHELESAAGLALVVAAARFDPARGATFKTYLVLVVRRRLAGAAHEWRRGRRAVEFSALDGSDDGAGFDPVEHRAADPARLASSYELAALALSVLPARTGEALWRIHAEGQSMSEVADRWEVTRQNVAQHAERAVRLAQLAVGADA